MGNAGAIQCMIFTDFLLTFLFGVSLGPFRDLNCSHIFNNNMFLKLSEHGHGAAPKLIICSAALSPTKPCNYSCFWQPQTIPSLLWYFPVEGHGVSYSFLFQWDKYVIYQSQDAGEPPEVLVSKWQADNCCYYWTAWWQDWERYFFLGV